MEKMSNNIYLALGIVNGYFTFFGNKKYKILKILQLILSAICFWIYLKNK